MKERLKAFILKTIGEKLPDDISADVLKSCNIKLIDAQKLLRYADLIVASSERNNLWIGVSYSDHVQSAMLHICSGHNGLQWKPVFLKNLKFGEGLDLLCKLIEEDVIEIPEFQETQCLKFNDEDKVDHRTVALLATCNGKWLLSINLKHHMLTLPIGKVHPNESLLGGLCREMREELGFPDLVYTYGPSNIILKTKFKKTYDFDGTPVNVETFVFHVNSDERYANGIWGVAENREPEKCGGLMWVNRDDIRRIAESTGLLLADCVDAALNSDTVLVNHEVVPTGMPIISGIDKVKMREKAKRLKQ